MGQKIISYTITILVLFNLLFSNCSVYARSDTSFSFDKENVNVNSKKQFTLTIAGKNVTNLYAYDIEIKYDPDKLKYISSGSEMSWKYIKDDGDTIYCVFTKLGNEPTENGNLDLCNLTFEGESSGITQIEMKEVNLVDRNANGDFNKTTYTVNKTVSVVIRPKRKKDKTTSEVTIDETSIPESTPISSEEVEAVIGDVNDALERLISDNDDTTLENIRNLAPNLVNAIMASTNTDTTSKEKLKQTLINALNEIKKAASTLDTDDNIKKLNDYLAQIITDTALNLDDESDINASKTLLESIKEVISASSNLLDKVDSAEIAKEMAISIMNSVSNAVANEANAGAEIKKAEDKLLDVVEKVVRKYSREQVEPEVTGNSATAKIDELKIQAIIDKMDDMVKAVNDLQTKLNDNGITQTVEKKVTIDIPVTDEVKDIKADIPKELFQAAKGKGVDKIEIVSGLATISLPSDFIKETQTSQYVSLEAKKVELSDEERKQLSKEQKKLVDAGATIFDFNAFVTDDSGVTKKVLKFEKSLDIEIPYTLKDGEDADNITVLYLADDGTIKNMIAKYDADTRTVKFTTNHFSSYMIKNYIKTFSDVPDGVWYKKFVESMVSKGLVNGKSEDEFDPNGFITRGEFAKLISVATGIVNENALESFNDVAPDAWYTPYIASASNAGIITGYPDGTFKPNEKITREQMAVMVARALDENEPKNIDILANFIDNDKISVYALNAMAISVKDGIITGNDDNVIEPKGNATRAEAATVIYRLFNYLGL